MKRAILTLLICALGLASCVRQPSVNTNPAAVTNASTDARLTVTNSIQYIDARGYARNIAIVHDAKSQQDYLFVEGAGVVLIESKTECDSNGKNCHAVEVER